MAVALALAASASPGRADAPTTATALPPIPRLAPTTLPAPEPTAIADLDAWLAKVIGEDAEARKAAMLSLDETAPAGVPAVARKLAELRRTANRDAMATIVTAARKKGGERADDEARAPRAKKGAAAKSAPEGPELVDRLLASARPDVAAWRDATAVVALSRVLVKIGSAPAARELVALYPAFGDLFRVDVQRQIAKLGERATAALLEARHFGDPRTQTWAGRQLDAIGKTVPGEAIQTTDNQVLADVLRAYGRTKDVEALRVVVSFASSDRVQVRDASREAIGAVGEAGRWQLKDSYENLVGHAPAPGWDWERTARELFAAYDRARLAEVYAWLDEGLAAERAGKLDEMASAYDKVLARAPLFERRAEMVAGYVAFAAKLGDDQRAQKLAVLRKALRIDDAGARAPALSSEIAFLEAEEIAARGVVDTGAYEKVLALDPSHAGAKAALARLTTIRDAREGTLRRWAAAIAIGVAALLGALAVWMRRHAD